MIDNTKKKPRRTPKQTDDGFDTAIFETDDWDGELKYDYVDDGCCNWCETFEDEKWYENLEDENWDKE